MFNFDLTYRPVFFDPTDPTEGEGLRVSVNGVDVALTTTDKEKELANLTSIKISDLTEFNRCAAQLLCIIGVTLGDPSQAQTVYALLDALGLTFHH